MYAVRCEMERRHGGVGLGRDRIPRPASSSGVKATVCHSILGDEPMVTIIVQNLGEDVVARLKRRASLNNRSDSRHVHQLTTATAIRATAENDARLQTENHCSSQCALRPLSVRAARGRSPSRASIASRSTESARSLRPSGCCLRPARGSRLSERQRPLGNSGLHGVALPKCKRFRHRSRVLRPQWRSSPSFRGHLALPLCPQWRKGPAFRIFGRPNPWAATSCARLAALRMFIAAALNVISP